MSQTDSIYQHWLLALCQDRNVYIVINNNNNNNNNNWLSKV